MLRERGQKIEKNVAKRACPVCKEKIGIVLHRTRFDTTGIFQLPSEYDLISCDTCGMCYADTAATREEYEEYYTNHNYYGGGWKYNSSSAYEHKMISRVLSHYVGKDCSVTDIGCGNGLLLDCLYKEGFRDLCGIDPAEDSVKEIREKYTGFVGSVYEKPMDGYKKTMLLLCRWCWSIYYIHWRQWIILFKII